jgi:hypothetical protein
MTRGVRRIALAALAAGAVGGAVAAGVRGEERAPRPAPPDPAHPRVEPAPRDPARLPDGRYDPGRAHYRVDRGSVRIDGRAADPGGGPDWVVRVFDVEQISISRPQRTLARPAYRSHQRCAELGREYRGRFGWIDGEGVFRPAAPANSPFHLRTCERATPRARSADFVTAVRFGDDPSAPRALRSALWGFARPGEAVRARGAAVGGERRIEPGVAGGFLLLAAPGASVAGLRVKAGPELIRLDGALERALGPREPVRRRFRRGTMRLEAPAPDPGGGPAMGVVVADDRKGSPCIVGEGSQLGERFGGFVPEPGLFVELSQTTCEPPGFRPTRETPVPIRFGYNSWSLFDGAGPHELRGRVERRVALDRSSVTAVCHPDVVSVTLRTPRDIRTLVPSPHAHVIHAVYAGDFGAGRIVAVAHMRDGTKRRLSTSVGF